MSGTTEKRVRTDWPQARLRMEAKDHGIVLRHGDGPQGCDWLVTRNPIVFESDGIYYMHYDAGGDLGWVRRGPGQQELQLVSGRGPAFRCTVRRQVGNCL